MALAQTLIDVVPTEALVGQEAWTFEIVSLVLCNVTSDPEMVRVFAAAAGAELGPASTVVDELILEPHTTTHFSFPLILEAGDRLVAQASFGGRASLTAAYRKTPQANSSPQSHPPASSG